MPWSDKIVRHSQQWERKDKELFKSTLHINLLLRLEFNEPHTREYVLKN